MQGIALVSGFACCFEGRRCALKVAKEADFEAMKERAIDADVADELSTSIYVAEQQRRKEAEAILAASGEEVEAARESLEVLYSNDLQDSTSTPTSNADASDLALWWKVSAAEVEGKSPTWIIENILNMKGRKFTEGKARLVELREKFGEG